MTISKNPGESDKSFILRCMTYKSGMTWDELAIVVSDALDEHISGDALRHRVRTLRQEEPDSRIETTDDIFRKLQREKQTLRDERNSWQKQNREQARTDENFKILAEHLDAIQRQDFPTVPIPRSKTEPRTMLILLTDWHIGLDCKSIYGTYSTDIARERVNCLTQRIADLQAREHCEAAVVITAGDLIHGAIHRTVQIQSRQTVTEQIKAATELLASFLHALLSEFKHVTFTGCSGNHSRLQENKDSALHDERADDLINWMTGKLLSNSKHFSYIPPLDSSIASVSIYGHEILAVHGDYDKMNKNGVQGLVTSLRRFPYAVCYGHMHSPAMLEAQGILAIQGGSLCGAGDDYTVQKRLSGQASQTICIFTEEGLEQIRPIFL